MFRNNYTDLLRYMKTNSLGQGKNTILKNNDVLPPTYAVSKSLTSNSIHCNTQDFLCSHHIFFPDTQGRPGLTYFIFLDLNLIIEMKETVYIFIEGYWMEHCSCTVSNVNLPSDKTSRTDTGGVYSGCFMMKKRVVSIQMYENRFSTKHYNQSLTV